MWPSTDTFMQSFTISDLKPVDVEEPNHTGLFENCSYFGIPFLPLNSGKQKKSLLSSLDIDISSTQLE